MLNGATQSVIKAFSLGFVPALQTVNFFELVNCIIELLQLLMN